MSLVYTCKQTEQVATCFHNPECPWSITDWELVQMTGVDWVLIRPEHGVLFDSVLCSERERKNNYERAWEERVKKKRSRVGLKKRLCLAVSLDYGGAKSRCCLLPARAASK